jgi:Myristoyl-CoA:protein N-myristoyltransferase, C-terminal domain
LFYYAADIAFEEGAEASGRLKKRLEHLIGDALIIAKQAKFDVFNALTLMDNVPILKDLKVSFWSCCITSVPSDVVKMASLELETVF